MDLMKVPLVSALPSCLQKRGLSGSQESVSKRCLSAATGQVGCPGAAATCMETPFQKGSVFEAGSVRMMWVGFSKLRMN